MWFEKDFINELNQLQKMVENFIHQKYEESKTPIYTNLYEDKDKIYAVMPISGVSKEDIDIQYQNKKLFVKTKKEAEVKDIKRVVRTERYLGEFVREIDLETPIDADKIHAKYENGLLWIEMTKAEEAKPKKIMIE